MSAYRGNIEHLEAALVEMGRGMTYPPTPVLVAPMLPPLEREGARRTWWPSLRPVTPRLVLIIVLALVLVGCAAAATYVATQTNWLRSSPRGVQFTDDFGLVELFRPEPEADYQHLTIGPLGKGIYAVRRPRTGIVRIIGLQEEQAKTEVLFSSNDLKAPALWDPGTDLSGTVLVECCSDPRGKLSVAGNGDLFFLANASTGTTFSGTSLIVRQADGRLQKVLTIRELVDAGLLPPDATDRGIEHALAASAPDRLWILLQGRSGEQTYRRFYAVEDPNGDGDWSDRAVTHVSLPDFTGAGDGPTADDISWFIWQMIAEPSLGGEDRTRSFLLQMNSLAGEHRIYRVSDQNSDGDALDSGEFELLFVGVGEMIVAPRVVMMEGKVLVRELVIGRTRVSRITEAGEVVDIARAFRSITTVLADSEGNIYVWAYPPDWSSGPTLYKLKPE